MCLRKALPSVIALCCLQYISSAQGDFYPANMFGGSPIDVVNDPPDGKVGIGDFMNRANPIDPLTVGGDISLYPSDDNTERNIWGRTDGGIFSLYSGLNNVDGSAIRLHGASNPVPGLLQFISYDYNNGDLGFSFDHYDVSGSGGYQTSFAINKYGRARVGSAAPITNDRLTVDGSVYVYDPIDQPRGILARSSVANLDLFSGSALSDGTSINLFAMNHPNYRGSMYFNAPNIDGANFKWRSVSGSSPTDKMVLDIGGGLHLSNNIMFDLASQYSWNYIRGHKSTAVLAIMSNTGSNNGSGIEMNGPTTANSPGMLTFCSYGAHPVGFRFMNTSSLGVQKDVLKLDNNSNLHLGNDILFDLSSQNTWDYIMGYKTNGVLAVMANSGSNDGSGIEFYGNSAVSNPGSMALFVNGDNPGGSGYDFVKYASGAHTSLMNIQKDGKVRIGSSSLSTGSNNYMLFVEKGILTEKVRVAVSTYPPHELRLA